MQLLADHNVTHVSYILILYSIAFLMYLFVNILLHIYAVATWPDDESNGVLEARAASYSSGPGGAMAQQRGMSLAGLPPSAAGRLASGGMHSRKASALGYSDVPPNMNGAPMKFAAQQRMPRHRGTDSQQVRDAEEFELEGLISEDEEAGMRGSGSGSGAGSGETGLTSPMLGSGSEDGRVKREGRSKIGSGV